MAKDTSKILEELKTFSDFESFIEQNSESLNHSELSECLNEIVKEKGLNKAKIIERAQLGEVYAYQIFSGIRKNPDRNKLIALAFGMELDFEQTQNLLKKTGYAPLYAKNPFDCIIIYALYNGYSIIQANEMLYDYGLETLG